MKWWVIILMLVLGAGIGLSVVFHRFWFPGFTEAQTVEILLTDQKLGFRAFDKAKRHGPSILNEIARVTNDFTSVDYYQASIIVRLLNEVDLDGYRDYGEELFGRESLPTKLFGAYILARTDGLHIESLFKFLKSVASREYPEMDTNVFRALDYYPEVAIYAIGSLGGQDSYEYLVSVLSERPAPYERHAAVVRALAMIGDDRAINVLRTVMLNPDFKATLPAYESLLILGDVQARQIAEMRVSMNLGDELLKERIERRSILQ